MGKNVTLPFLKIVEDISEYLDYNFTMRESNYEDSLRKCFVLKDKEARIRIEFAFPLSEGYEFIMFITKMDIDYSLTLDMTKALHEKELGATLVTGRDKMFIEDYDKFKRLIKETIFHLFFDEEYNNKKWSTTHEK